MNDQKSLPSTHHFATCWRLRLWVLIGLSSLVFTAYEGVSHPKPHRKMHVDSVSVATKTVQATATQVSILQPMPAPLADYPTYHPMVVHAPIMLLVLAALLQLVVLLKPSIPLNWLTFLVAACGMIGAYVASTFVHPHTDGLSDAAQLTLETHETYADYTLWLGLAGTVLKGVTLWRPVKWLEAIAALILIGAGIYVSLAAHQGGALTYQYGIGPRGAYLEQHEEGHADGNRHEHQHSEKAR